MTDKLDITRRKFLGSAATTAATISIVPRHVVAGSGRTPPSEQIAIANIGCGTQGLRELDSLLCNDKVRVVAVCDPNKYSTDYIDWSPHGLRDRIRRTLRDDGWGAGEPGIPGGRDVATRYVESYYGRNNRSGQYKGCASYEDFRELLSQESDIDAVKIMTPDHLHASIASAAMDRGVNVVTHKPVANRMAEARHTINKARETGLITHLLAWAERPQLDLILKWIRDGVIGDLKEIHNWTNRPVWKQWAGRPSGTPPIPDGFNWDLWLGPVQPIPYHPHYTHNVFRGWYEFGGGSFADMGHYSLFPLFEKLGITRPPIAAEAFGTTTRELDGNVYRWDSEDVAFPLSCMIRLDFPEQQALPPFQLFWYDGGMKPFAPPELLEDGREMPETGLLLVGDKGKILSGFRGRTPQIIPRARMRDYDGPKFVTDDKDDEDIVDTRWVDSIASQTQSPGSFQRAQTVTEAINLAIVALRTGKRLEYDSSTMHITNDEGANNYLHREYREGWELG